MIYFNLCNSIKLPTKNKKIIMIQQLKNKTGKESQCTVLHRLYTLPGHRHPHVSSHACVLYFRRCDCCDGMQMSEQRPLLGLWLTVSGASSPEFTFTIILTIIFLVLYHHVDRVATKTEKLVALKQATKTEKLVALKQN